MFNNTVTHESQLAGYRIDHYVSQGSIPEQPRIDPQELELPHDMPVVRQALLQMVQADDYAANRIMAAQALAWCGDPDTAFQALMHEASEATVGYVMLLAINALQYSKTDYRLSMEDWKLFRDKRFENDYGVQFARRIIDDAIELYPEKRKVY